MHAPELSPMTNEEARFIVRALKSVATSDGGMSDEERALIAVSSELLGPPPDPKVSQIAPPPTPEGAAALFKTEAARRRFIQMLLVVGMIDNDFSAEELAVVKGYTAALAVRGDWIDRARRIIAGHLLMMRLDVARRVPPTKLGANDTWGEQVLSSTWDLMRGAGRSVEDAEMAWRYKRLGLLPRGTLGREYWAYMTSRRFLLPGERGAPGAGTTYHDFVHALCGYDTDPTGEAEITAFTAGMLKMDDPIPLILGSMSMILLSAKLQAGVRLPVLKLDYDRIGRAHRRGLRATAELTERWDTWSVVGERVDALVERYAIQPE
jgi:hypothetical protein